MKSILKAYDPFKKNGFSYTPDSNISLITARGKTITFDYDGTFELLEIAGKFREFFISACNHFAGKKPNEDSIGSDFIKEQFRKKARGWENTIANYENYDHFKHWMKAEFSPTRYDIFAFPKETRGLVSAYGKARKEKDDNAIWNVIADIAICGILWADSALFHMAENETAQAVKYAMKAQELYSIARAISANHSELKANTSKGGQRKQERNYAMLKQEFNKFAHDFFKVNPASIRGNKRKFEKEAGEIFTTLSDETIRKWRREYLQ